MSTGRFPLAIKIPLANYTQFLYLYSTLGGEARKQAGPLRLGLLSCSTLKGPGP